MSILEKERSLLEALIADEAVASSQLTDTKRHLCTGRFLTMHKRRRKKLQTRSLLVDNAILDDVLHGQVQIMLDRVGNWRFNAFTLETVTGGRSLPVLCVHLFHWYGLLDHFNLDVVRVWKLFSLIEEGYHSTNPYHNSIHATDVTQAMHCFLQESKILEYLEPLEIMASLIGAVTHDLDHPGVNQPFLIATSNHLAALYENTSVLENHHWRSAIGCLLESGVAYDIQPIRPELEKQIASLILATDITRQQEFIGQFREYLNTETLDMRIADHRHFILQIALKCADISNPCRPWDISKKWSQKVCEEFFRQGDYERQLNLPVTSLCDRQSTSVPKIQTGFFRFVVTPLMDEWHRFLKSPLSHKMMYHLKYNQNQWEGRLQAEIAEETRTEISDAELLEEELEENEEDEDNNYLDISDSAEVLIPAIKITGRRSSLQVPAFGANRFERRHSMPVHSVPKIILPPTELLPTRPQESILESDENRFDNDSLSLLSSDSDSNHRARSSTGSAERERPLSAENLLPDLNLTSMTDSLCAGKLNFVIQGGSNTPNFLSVQTSKHLIRQQTFPPLQPYIRARYMSSTAELGACPEALIESRSSSSNDSNIECCSETRGVLLNKKDSFKREQDYYSTSEKASKVAKLTIVPGQKENLDPSMLRRSLARRRGSAPVTVALPKPTESDAHVSIVMNNMRRGSVPVDAIKMTSMETNVQPDVVTTSVVPPNSNNNQRRSSVPNDASNVISRNSFNGKRRNQKKILRRRSSGGAEIFSSTLSETLEASPSGSSNNGSAWYRFKRDITRRSDKDQLLTRRRGSLPVEVLTVGLAGTLRH